jgi:hypothetical protein
MGYRKLHLAPANMEDNSGASSHFRGSLLQIICLVSNRILKCLSVPKIFLDHRHRCNLSHRYPPQVLHLLNSHSLHSRNHNRFQEDYRLGERIHFREQVRHSRQRVRLAEIYHNHLAALIRSMAQIAFNNRQPDFRLQLRKRSTAASKAGINRAA